MNENKYLDFCTQNQITTGHFDKGNSGQYTRKRENLYRQLGIPLLAVRDAEILEIGPGAGHNTIPLLCDWNCKCIDLVEPNDVAVKGLEKVFGEMKIETNRYRIFPVTLEQYKTDRTYDIVIAEGYIQYAHNWKELMQYIKSCTHKYSIVIVTCMDDFSIYVEMLKRFVGQYMVRNIDGGLNDKVAFLSEEWKESFKCLPGMTRTVEEWLLDWVFNQGILCDNLMTIKCAIEEMQGDYDVLGCSQNIFVDYSWYKDLDYDYVTAYKDQYDRKKHMFLTSDIHEECVHDIETNEKLQAAIKSAVDIIRRFEIDKETNLCSLYAAIDAVTALTDNERIWSFNEDVKEIINIFNAGQRIEYAKYGAWNATFGKSMQYISFQRK